MRLVPMMIAMVGVTLLSGCASLDGPTPAQLAASDDATCLSYGFKPKTDTYANCRLQLAQGRAQRRTAISAAMLAQPGFGTGPYFFRHPYFGPYTPG